MKQVLQNFKSGELKIADVPTPALKSGGVLVRNVSSFISAGTERMLIDFAEKSLMGPQMREAIVSVTNNIAEGHGRWHYKENIQFCRISRGSAEEILDDINVCLDEGYGDKKYNEELKEDGYFLRESSADEYGKTDSSVLPGKISGSYRRAWQ